MGAGLRPRRLLQGPRNSGSDAGPERNGRVEPACGRPVLSVGLLVLAPPYSREIRVSGDGSGWKRHLSPGEEPDRVGSSYDLRLLPRLSYDGRKGDSRIPGG